MMMKRLKVVAAVLATLPAMLCTGCNAAQETVTVVDSTESAVTTGEVHATETLTDEEHVAEFLKNEEHVAEILKERPAGAFQYDHKGWYNMAGFYDLEVYQYEFPYPNNFYQALVCENLVMMVHYEGANGPVFWESYCKDAKFVGITEDYCIFEKDGEKYAVTIAERPHVEIGESLHVTKSYDELTAEEKASVVYPENVNLIAG